MAESQTPPSPNSDPAQYWCYQCNRRVSVETLSGPTDLVCTQCKDGFVEPIISPSPTTNQIENLDLDPSFNNQFIQVLRLIAQAAHVDDDTHVPPPPPSDPSGDDDYLRIELDGWDNNNDNDNANDNDDEDDDEDDADDDDDENENEYHGNLSDDENGQEDDVRRRMRRDVLQLRLRDFALRAARRRNRILDWADILTGLEDHSIELRLQLPGGDGYVGNPGDYVDAAGYEALLQNLAESDGTGRRGAPPAAKSAVLGLESVEIDKEEDVFACAICKDCCDVGVGIKKLPCGHGYHGDCIVPWLASRNSCPVCRFELPTDDLEYEEGKKKGIGGGGGGGGSSSSGFD